MRALLLTLLLAGCVPIHVGPGRVLPVALQYDPEAFAGPASERKAEVPRTFSLPNGLEVVFVEDHSSPVVDVSVLVGCGRGDEPTGIPELTGAMLRGAFKAGAGSLDGPAQRRAWSAIGAYPDSTYDDGESWVSFSVRADDLPRSVELLRDALESPRYEPVSVATEMERWGTRIDSPLVRHSRLARRTRARAIYGSVPALSAVATADSVRLINHDVLATHASLCLQTANLVFAVTGDVTEEALTAALAPVGAMRTGSLMKHLPPGTIPTERWIWLVPTTLTSNVVVEVVAPGLPPGTRDRAAARVLMAALMSRMQYELRQRMGHIYSVSADVEVGPGTGATWFRFTTRSEVAAEAVRIMLIIIESWWANWPFDDALTKKVVAAMRSNNARGEPFGHVFQAARERLQDRGNADPRSYDEQLAQVTEEGVRNFFAETFKPDRLQVIISGNFLPTFNWEQFGPVTRVEPVR